MMEPIQQREPTLPAIQERSILAAEPEATTLQSIVVIGELPQEVTSATSETQITESPLVVVFEATQQENLLSETNELPTAEAAFEYMGSTGGVDYAAELLLATLFDLVKLETAEQVPEPLDYYSLISVPGSELSVEEREVARLERLLPAEFEAAFSANLVELAPEQVLVAMELMSDLLDMVTSAEFLELSPEDNEILQENLIELSIKLFDCLGIACDEALILPFIETIQAFEQMSAIETEKLSARDLNNLGTREFKSLLDDSLLSRFAAYVRRSLLPTHLLGRYTLQLYAL
jgi:hypothetical protein